MVQEILVPGQRPKPGESPRDVRVVFHGLRLVLSDDKKKLALRFMIFDRSGRRASQERF